MTILALPIDRNFLNVTCDADIKTSQTLQPVEKSMICIPFLFCLQSIMIWHICEMWLNKKNLLSVKKVRNVTADSGHIILKNKRPVVRWNHVAQITPKLTILPDKEMHAC